jgi:cytochrome c oxidase cbb3-type subunit 3
VTTIKGRFIATAMGGLLIASQLSAQGPPPGGRGGRGGGRGPNFPQQTRAMASPDVLARGKGLYGVNCTGCHGADLRGGDQGGPNLLRSMLALSDQHGELISPIIQGSRQAQGMPAFNLPANDCTALAEYIHSVLALVGSQGRPPGSEDGANLKVLVGNSAAGQTLFNAKCASCHSVSGDLMAIGARYPEPRTLQNTWVSGRSGGGRGGRGGPPGADSTAKPTTVSVTLAGGQKVEGRLGRIDDFDVTLIESDGTRQTITRNGDLPRVEIHDPNEAHKKLVPTLSDSDMHNVTAYLATIK